jgi:hypothetical protein
MTPLDVLKRAMRLLGQLESGGTPTTDEQTDGLAALNGIFSAMWGNWIGPRLVPATYSAAATLYNGRRAECALTAATALTLPANPSDGARVGVTDVGNNFATFNLSVNRNGRLLEGGSSTLVLNTNGTSRSWFFRQDTGDWVREKALLIGDTIFFPDEICEHLPFLLAVRIVPEFSGDALPDAVVSGAALAEAAIKARYGAAQ